MATKIAIFCSGSGSNAQKIMEHFQNREDIVVAALLANKPDAYALKRAENFGIPTLAFNKEQFTENGEVIHYLKKHQIDWIILAGFLWLVPAYLVEAFPNKILNIHPALLPKFGGKGMYGHFVHEAVVTAGEKESGMTIHFVNTHYDEGNIIFQDKVALEATDTPEIVASKVLALEHKHFPRVIEETIKKSI